MTDRFPHGDYDDMDAVERQYAFTGEQLFVLLKETIGMFREYMQAHEYDEERAIGAAVDESLEGLDAERELFDHGELKAEQLTQVYGPPDWVERAEEEHRVGLSF